MMSHRSQDQLRTYDGRILDLNTEVYIMGMGNVGKLLAHSLRGLPKPPGITMIMQSPADESEFRENQKQIVLTSNGKAVGRSGFGIEFMQSQENKAVDPLTELRNLLERDTPIRNLVVAKKSQYQVEGLMAIKNRLNKDSAILFVQNGIGLIEEVDQKVFTDPDNKPTYLTAVVGHGLYSESRFSVVHAGHANITLGLSQTSARAFKLCQLSTRAQGLESAGPGDITHASARYLIDILVNTPELAATEHSPLDLFVLQLLKLAVNCVLNPLTTLVGCRNGELLQNAWAKDTMRELLAEISQVIRSLPELKQHHLSMEDRFSPESLEKIVVGMADKTANNFSSMLQDSRKGRSTEIQYINGYIVQRGKHLGIPCETNSKVIDMVRAKTEN